MNGLGAGDGFGGSLAHGLLAGWPLETILARANAAGALVATRLECSTAMPTPAEIDELLGTHGMVLSSAETNGVNPAREEAPA